MAVNCLADTCLLTEGIFLRIFCGKLQEPEIQEIEIAAGEEQERHILFAVNRLQGEALLGPICAAGEFHHPAQLGFPGLKAQVDGVVFQLAFSPDGNLINLNFPLGLPHIVWYHIDSQGRPKQQGGNQNDYHQQPAVY